MKPSAHLVNVARGRVVDEDALIRALQEKRIAAAGLDVTREEPLPAASPLWAMPNVLITPHTAGETQRYEDGVIDLLVENLDRLWRGETTLKNQIVLSSPSPPKNWGEGTAATSPSGARPTSPAGSCSPRGTSRRDRRSQARRPSPRGP